MLIAISKYIKPLSEVDAHRAEHVQYLKSYYTAGKILTSGRQNPPDGGVIISHKLSLKEFQEILKNDPFVKNKVAEYKITEFIPTLYSDLIKDILL